MGIHKVSKVVVFTKVFLGFSYELKNAPIVATLSTTNARYYGFIYKFHTVLVLAYVTDIGEKILDPTNKLMRQSFRLVLVHSRKSQVLERFNKNGLLYLLESCQKLPFPLLWTVFPETVSNFICWGISTQSRQNKLLLLNIGICSIF